MKRLKERFCIFTTHTDHAIRDGLYEKTAMKIHEFVTEFLGKEDLPFILGGDMNAFEQLNGADFVDLLRNGGPFRLWTIGKRTFMPLLRSRGPHF